MFLSIALNDPDLLIGILAVCLLSACGLVMLVRWLLSGPTRPDPWNEEVAAAIAGENGVPLCHRCLAPHDPLVNFCAECGAPVGDYTNLLPYPYLFSIGHTLRIGTEGNFRRSPLVVAGFFLFGIAEYALLAPVYWFLFLKNLSRQSRSGPPPESPAESPSDAAPASPS